MSYHAADPLRRATVEAPREGAFSEFFDRLRAWLTPRAGRGLRNARDPVALARAIGAARRQRGEVIDPDLFAEPAWDLLLELYIATREESEVPVSSASTVVGVPVSVSLRWIKELEMRGLVSRRAAQDDHHREFLVLSAKGLQKMEALLRTMLLT